MYALDTSFLIIRHIHKLHMYVCMYIGTYIHTYTYLLFLAPSLGHNLGI